MKNFRKFLTPKFIDKWTDVYREKGFKGMIKAMGWKVVLAFFLFYLIRDSTLYIILPYLAAKGMITGCN